MSGSQGSSTAACGCCDGISVVTPVEVVNAPALAAISYRIGTHSRFKQSMLARLSASGRTALAGLRKREDADFSIALLDAWAVVADVLTFYQERVANESYLRTATERRSLLELARLIGYELRPGVAASTYLAFTVEESRGVPALAPKRVPIDKGTRVQSIPAPDEKPQVYETVESIEARPEWNTMRPRLTRRHPVVGDTQDPLLFEGLATGLRPGDGLLLFPDAPPGGPTPDPVFRQVTRVVLKSTEQRTQVMLDPPPARLSALPTNVNVKALAATQFQAFGSKGISTASIKGPVTSASMHAASIIYDFHSSDVFSHLLAMRTAPPGVFAFRLRASVFGHNAPKWGTLPVSQRVGENGPKPGETPSWGFIPGPYAPRESTWAEVALSSYPISPAEKKIYLDNVYPTVVAGSWVALKSGTASHAYKVNDTAEVSVSDFTLSAKVTRLETLGDTGFSSHTIRNTTVFAQSEELKLARLPVTEPVAGEVIELEGWIDGLRVGQSVIICGELDAMRGVRACERAALTRIEHVMETEGATKITVAALANAYVRETVAIYGNVARATHGEAVQEVLGSGDASQNFQTLTLKQPPLTYVKAPVPSGAASTLEVRVNDLLWHEVPSLYGHAPDDHVYVTRIEDDGTTRVKFGDGKSGARLPTGRQNVRARYRRGIGLEGLVDAGQLSMLLTRPLGVSGVTNPLDAEGAADRESLRDVRTNAPLTMLTLDRAVSLRDYEDFARAFSGIAKAMATWASDGASRNVFITVAGPGGALVPESGDTCANLVAALAAAGDPFASPRVRSYRPALFRVHGRVKLHPDYLADQVLSAIDEALHSRFSFDARAFGQPVMLSEVIARIQAVPGVIAVDVDRFVRTDDPERALGPRLDAAAPLPGAANGMQPAELLTLDPAPVELGVMA
jgi:predicted phage baseplate assembly protein